MLNTCEVIKLEILNSGIKINKNNLNKISAWIFGISRSFIEINNLNISIFSVWLFFLYKTDILDIFKEEHKIIFILNKINDFDNDNATKYSKFILSGSLFLEEKYNITDEFNINKEDFLLKKLIID